MTGEIRARDILVLRSWRASYRILCLAALCPSPLGARYPDYAGAKADRAEHLHWHGNQHLQELHQQARRRVARMTPPGLLRGR